MQVISANRLADGTVVYVGRDGSWVERLAEARVFATKPEADTGLLAAQSDVKRNLVVDPFLVDVCEKPGGLRPVTLRESIRAEGPTIDFLPKVRPAARNARPAPEEEPAGSAAAILHRPRREEARAHGAKELSLRAV